MKEEARQIIADRLGPDESQALPTVIEIDGRYHMFFCYRQSFDFRTNQGSRLSHRPCLVGRSACTGRGTTTIRCSTSRPGDWDSDMLCYPHVFECDGKVYLLYNGNEFGRYGFGLAVLEA